MKLTKCTNCESLEELTAFLECTLVHLAKGKYNSEIYNLNYCPDMHRFKSLMRYKRILKRRLYDPTYPCSSVKISDIITQVSLLVDQENCSRCFECDIEII